MKHRITKSLVAALAAGLSGVTAVHAQVSCGAVVTTKTVMTGNLSCLFDNPAVTIDGGELDMNGHRIACLPGSDGVAMINSGGKLRNGSIDGCDRAVVLAGSGRHTVINITATNGAETGFFALGSGNKLIQNSASGFAQDGFRAATALPPLSDTFFGNIAANNGGDGFQITGDRTSMVGNIAVGNGNAGIVIDGEGNKVSRNTAYDNNSMGIYVGGNKNNVALNSTIGNQSHGLGIFSTGSKVKQNLSIGNDSNGVVSNSTGAVYSRNSSILNGQSGFDILGSDIQVAGSVAALNQQSGIWTRTGHTNLQLKSNRVLSNGAIGIDVDSGTTTAKGNLAYDNFTIDADDANSLCSTNTWIANVFGSKADACIE